MNDKQLKQVLHEWKPEARVPASFRANVWERIAARQAAREQAPMAKLQQWLTGFFLRPAPVAVLGAAMLTLGIGTGWWKGSRDRADGWTRLEAQYVESIDPYARTHAPTVR